MKLFGKDFDKIKLSFFFPPDLDLIIFWFFLWFCFSSKWMKLSAGKEDPVEFGDSMGLSSP